MQRRIDFLRVSAVRKTAMKGGGFTTRERKTRGLAAAAQKRLGDVTQKKALVDYYYYYYCYTHRHLPVYSRRRHQLHTSRSRFTSVWLLHSTGPPVPPLVSLDSFCWCVFPVRSFVCLLCCFVGIDTSRHDYYRFFFQWHCVVLTYLTT